jgi:FkbM family methyltransferase
MSEIQLLRVKPGMTPEQCRIIPWFNVEGDKNLRLNYDLGPQAVVYDVGGYVGSWAQDIYKKYGCTVEVFEPVKDFSDGLERKFASNPNVNVHSFGLSDKTRMVNITLDGPSSSTNKSSGKSERVQLVKAADFIKNRHQKIALMKINIEGDEYPLINHLIESGLITRIENVQVQFHNFVPNAAEKRQQLHDKLSKTHYLTYSYPWVWENWRRKK